MLGQILKWAALAALWAKVKPIFWVTLVTALFIFVVNVVHADFVEFLRVDQELSGTSGPLVSDVSKWLFVGYLTKLSLVGFSVVAYVFYLHYKGWPGAAKQSITHKEPPKKAIAGGSVTVQEPDPSQAPARFSEEFEFLRTDRPLRSRGQAILDAKRSA